jgi:hypothetical protein
MGQAQFNEPSLAQSEDVLGVFYGGDPLWGGKLIVTTQRLLFAPIDVGLVETITRYVAKGVAVPGADLAGQIIDQVKGSAKKEVWLRHIVSIEANGDGGWFKAPGVRIVTSTAQTIDFGIVKSTTTMNRDPGNRVVRDQLLAVLRQAVANASAN